MSFNSQNAKIHTRLFTHSVRREEVRETNADDLNYDNKYDIAYIFTLIKVIHREFKTDDDDGIDDEKRNEIEIKLIEMSLRR